MSAKSPLTQTNVGKSARANLMGLLTQRPLSRLLSVPVGHPVEPRGAFRHDDKSRPWEGLQANSRRAVAGDVRPAHERTLRRNGCCCRQPNPPGSDLYIYRGIYPNGTRFGARAVREVVTGRRNAEAHGLLDPPPVGNSQQFNGSVNRAGLG